MIRKSLTTLTAVALTAAFATVAGAQTAPRQDPPELAAQLRAKGEAYSRAPDSEQNPAEVAATAQLNAQIVAQNEAAELMEHRGAMAGAEAETTVTAEAAEAARRYEADTAAYEAAQAEYMRARQVWEGLVQACVDSGRRNCTATAPRMDMPPPPPPPPPPVG
jgi:hypothetical protein